VTTGPSGTAGTTIQGIGCRPRKVTRGMTKSQDREGIRQGGYRSIMAQRRHRAAEVGRLIETTSKGNYRTHKGDGTVR
jgi:hypothetical protein